MADIGQLRNRIEQVAERLTTAQAARARENEQLKSRWEELHERFQEQNAEISRLRGQVVDLKGDREELISMVQGLITAVEKDLETESSAVAVPLGDTAFPAHRLHEAIPARDIALPPEPDAPGRDANDENEGEYGDFLAAIERSLHDESIHDGLVDDEELILPDEDDEASFSIPETTESFEDAADEGTANEVPVLESSDAIEIKPLSPSIRDLVKRLEGVTLDSVGRKSPEIDSDKSADDGMQEIEILGNEFPGFRKDIAKAG